MDLVIAAISGPWLLPACIDGGALPCLAAAELPPVPILLVEVAAAAKAAEGDLAATGTPPVLVPVLEPPLW